MCEDIEYAAMQVSEVEALQSIFCRDNEFELNTPGLLTQLTSDSSTGRASLSSISQSKMVGFTIRLRPLEGPEFSFSTLELHVRLPKKYPSVPPLIMVTSWSQTIDKSIVEDLRTYARSLVGDAMIMQLVMHLKENIGKYITRKCENGLDCVSNQVLDPALFILIT